MRENAVVKNMVKDALVLFCITLAAGLLLGLVYQITKNPIQEQEQKAKEQACREVFAKADSFAVLEDIEIEEATAEIQKAGYANQSFGDYIMGAYDQQGNCIGYVLTITSGEGYGGDIVFTMGIQMDGTLNGISLLSISETPGLGMKAEEVLKPQFANKNVPLFEYTKSGAVSQSQINAISGATITTRAITNGVNAGLTYFQEILAKGGNSNE